LTLTTAVAAMGVHRLPAQTAAPAHDVCAERERDDSRRAHHCEVRDAVFARSETLDVDPGQNGGVHIRAWDRADVRLRTRVEASAETDARARDLVASVRVTTLDGRIRSNGEMQMRDEHWATSFYLDVPANVRLAINTRNGGISLEGFTGTAELRAVNGGITLTRVGGDLRGHTQNGSLRIELSGTRWNGTGLDVATTNGAVQLTIPDNFSAELETGTVNGRVEIDFPMMIHAGRQRLFTTTLGAGGPKIRAMTTNGRVSVRRQ